MAKLSRARDVIARARLLGYVPPIDDTLHLSINGAIEQDEAAPIEPAWRRLNSSFALGTAV